MGLEPTKRRALYFGYVKGTGQGHTLYDEAVHSIGSNVPAGLPRLDYMDTGLLNNKKVPDVVDGRVHHKRYAVAGVPVWHAFVWWDRSGDSRPGSHSGIYVSGYEIEEIKEAWDYGTHIWFHIIKRQACPLYLPPQDPA